MKSMSMFCKDLSVLNLGGIMALAVFNSAMPLGAMIGMILFAVFWMVLSFVLMHLANR